MNHATASASVQRLKLDKIEDPEEAMDWQLRHIVAVRVQDIAGAGWK